MTGIFISYRREDAAPWAGRIYERLTKEFKADHIFMDVDNIAPGLNFMKELERSVGQCDVLLAIIGKGWAEARNSKGQRRLDDPRDFVRIELEAALARDVRVIPVLVDGATMPTEDELPEKLQPLIYRNAVELTHSRFGSDVQRLVEVVAPLAKPHPRDKLRPALNSRFWLRLSLLCMLCPLAFVAAIAWVATVTAGGPREQATNGAIGLGLTLLCTIIWFAWSQLGKGSSDT